VNVRRARRALGRTLALAALLGCASDGERAASVTAPAATGLDVPFPPATAAPASEEQVELGRLLFFDRVLSGSRDRACADCHVPALAFTDGRATAQGARGPLARNTPTLYNVGFKQRLFWDRRSPSLEAQVFGPLFSPDEMVADAAQLLARLRAIPEYVERFERAFGSGLAGGERAHGDAGDASAVDLERLARAIAAFERTLVSRDSRFDRFARGDASALDEAERRGLRSFRSLATRCFECHRLPTFDAPLALAIGVPSDDPGVGGATGNPAQRGHFAVPTLRNVARTAPYMHDGSLATLEDVVEFYRRGGGRAFGAAIDRVDTQIRAIDMSDAEAADLVAFLRSLDDESQRPATPDAVPSGLPVPR